MFLTISEVAALLKTSRQTLLKECRAGRFPEPQLLGTQYRFLLSDIEAWGRGEWPPVEQTSDLPNDLVAPSGQSNL